MHTMLVKVLLFFAFLAISSAKGESDNNDIWVGTNGTWAGSKVRERHVKSGYSNVRLTGLKSAFNWLVSRGSTGVLKKTGENLR